MSPSSDGPVAVACSRADRASMHVRDHLLDLREWTDSGGGKRTDGFELRTFDDWHLDLEGVAAAFDDPRFVVFASRHAGDTGPLLTAHFTGNFGPAEHGGRAGELAPACPAAAKRALAALDEYAPEGYDVGTECTHHGPSDAGAPSMFVELGSDEEQWDDPAGARAVARAVLSLGDAPATTPRTVVAFGGGHYAPRATRVVRETDWAVGHVAADWGLDALGDPAAHADVVAQVFERSGATRALVDGDRSDLVGVVDDLGYDLVSETWVRESRDVPLALVERLEAALCPVDEGLRFGVHAREADPDAAFEVRALPEDLVTAVNAVDQSATREAVASTTLAFETSEAGNRVEPRVAVSDWDALVDALVGVLDREYDAVERRDGAVVARRTAFDPAAARSLGVPEGPAFGRLAGGESVTVDGETVTPADVSREETERFPL